MADEHPSVAGIPIVLGGNVFSWTCDKDTGFAILDAFYEAGGRMIDTAETYGRQASGERGKESEAIIGEWMEGRGVRSEMRVATKTGIGDPGTLAPDKVARALEGSLERLRSDYVDIYYVHWDDQATPLEDVVRTYDEAYRAGKAKQLGGSNYSFERFKAAVDIADKTGAQPFTVLQPEYNLAVRDSFEGPLQDLCIARGIAVFPYFALASGFLTGKYRSAEEWKDSVRNFVIDKLDNPAAWNVLAVMDEIAKETGATHSMIAIAWLNAQPGVAAPIASARTLDQLDGILRAASFELTQEQRDRLTAAGTV